MEPTTIVGGVALGLAVAAPVGPIGILCIRRTLVNGRLAGFVSGLGAATADAIYAALAASGLAAAANLTLLSAFWLRVSGALFLCWLGYSTFRAPLRETSSATKGAAGIFGAYGSTLALTLSNPLTIASFAAIFAGLGVGQGTHAASLVLGVFGGSALWWLGLSTAVGMFRRRISHRVQLWINRVSGGIIVVFGLAGLVAILG